MVQLSLNFPIEKEICESIISLFLDSVYVYFINDESQKQGYFDWRRIYTFLLSFKY